MALTMWSLSAVVVDQLRLITYFNPLNPVYSTFRDEPRSLRPRSSPVRRSHGTCKTLGGEGAVMATLMLRWSAAVLSTPVFTLEPHGDECEICHVFRMPCKPAYMGCILSFRVYTVPDKGSAWQDSRPTGPPAGTKSPPATPTLVD